MSFDLWAMMERHRQKFFYLLIVVIIVLLVPLIKNWPTSCTEVKEVPAMVKVKVIPKRNMMGLNTDTDALKFGVLSPGMGAKRSVRIQHGREAEVLATMQGELEGWTLVDPANFTLDAEQGAVRQVYFEVIVPLDAAPGNYTGTAVFCLKEK